MSILTTDENSYDVVVVGGAAAGLSAALVLGRSRRRVLVVDGGQPRNAPAGHVHNYLAREGTPPADLYAIARAELAPYDVEMAAGEVTAVTATDGDTLGFDLALADGRTVTARRVIVATGVVDTLPDVPGLTERWGRDVLHCPYCHGWEVRDRAIAILASSPLATHHALLFGQLSADVVVVLADGVELAEGDSEKLGAIGVRLQHGTPTEVVVEDDRLVGLRMPSGEVLERDAVVVAAVSHVRADFLAPLGLTPVPFEMGGHVFGTVLEVGPTGATTVPGVYAAGNATDLSATVIGSAAAGMRAGSVVNAELAGEDATEAVARGRAEIFERPAWEDRYSGDPIWSGHVNAQLAAEVLDLAPGRALEVGCGEGGDVVWLARRGWQVTGMDFAEAALARTTAYAAQNGVGDRVSVRRADVRTWQPDGEQWDLVSAQFMHLPDGGMVDLTRRLAAAVAPGGTLLVVGHHPADMTTGMRHGHHDFMFRPDDLLPAIDAETWDVEVVEARPRSAHHHASGETVEVRDSVLRARRRP